MYRIIKLNDDLFKVNKAELSKIERDAYYVDPVTKRLTKDWVKITEWVEQHGELINKR